MTNSFRTLNREAIHRLPQAYLICDDILEYHLLSILIACNSHFSVVIVEKIKIYNKNIEPRHQKLLLDLYLRWTQSMKLFMLSLTNAFSSQYTDSNNRSSKICS